MLLQLISHVNLISHNILTYFMSFFFWDSRCGLCDTYYIAHVKNACAFLGDGMSRIEVSLFYFFPYLLPTSLPLLFI